MANPSNPIGGPGAPQGPRSSQGASSPDPNAFNKAVQKVEKAAEAENEGRSKQKYKTQEELLEDEAGPPQSPMALFSATPTPSPAPVSAPPPLASSTTVSPPSDTFEGLPHDPDFYEEMDISPNAPSTPTPQEIPSKGKKSSSKGAASIGAPEAKSASSSPAKKKEEETTPSILPSPPEDLKWAVRAKQKDEEEKGPTTRPPPEEPWMPGAPQPSLKGKPSKPVSRREESLRNIPQPPAAESTPSKKKGKSSEEPETMSSPSAQMLPAPIDAAAQNAVQRVAPYLSPEVAPLFYQMVGSILVMTTPPGISRTEVVLNAENFRSSVFFGSTITIEKYATAPDSLNIRLSGSPEAVARFQASIPTLSAAFERGNFKFRVGRLDAEYKTDRPLFRRKERGDKGGDLR